MNRAHSLRRPCATHSAFRPCLESLEDRAVPATLNVTTTLDVVNPADGKRSLREAITAANTTAGADVIVLPVGIYKLALVGASEDANATGDFDITGSVTIRGAGSGLTIIDAQQLDRVLDIRGSAPGSIAVTVENLQIRNGSTPDTGGGILVGNANLVVRDSVIARNQASGSGGGISNGAALGTGNITLVRTTVSGNAASSAGISNGGGIFSLANVLTIRDATVRRNIAATRGGGIYADTVNLTNSTLNGNAAGSAGGGGMDATMATLTNCIVSGNSAGASGGIAAFTATLINSTVSGNYSSTSGGGIGASNVTLTNSIISGNTAVGVNGGGILSTTAATLTNSTVSGNTAGNDGGGLYAITATVTNCTVNGNTAGGAGGGINAISTASLTNCTVSGNTALSGNGGGFNTNGGATLLGCTIVENLTRSGSGGGVCHSLGGTVNLKNSLVAMNLVGIDGVGPDVVGDFVSQGHNLIGVGGVGFTNGVNGDIVGTLVNSIDPKLGPLQNNGGKTKTMALLTGSPAIDHGDNAGAPATDQRGGGFARKKDGNFDGLPVVDIGAFEK